VIKIAKKLPDLIPIIIIGIALCAGFFVSLSDLPNRTLCFMKQVFHIDCPGCGMTRAFLLIPRGHFLEALSFNAAALSFYLLLFIIFITLIGRLRSKDFLSSLFWVKLRTWLAILCLALVTVQWFVRLYIYFSQHSGWEYIQSLVSGLWSLA
jgi:hypothetical protein